jgi:hypothetical protein
VPLNSSIHSKEHLDLKIENHLKENMRNSLKKIEYKGELTTEIIAEEIVGCRKNSKAKR